MSHLYCQNTDCGEYLGSLGGESCPHCGWTEPVSEAQQPAPMKDHSCKFPLCQTEDYQQMLAAQIAKELIGEQPRKAVKLSDEQVGMLTVFDGLHNVETPLLAEFIRAIEQAVLKKNGVAK